MRVTVSSHGQFHAFHLARQLNRHGVLERLLVSDPRALTAPGLPLAKVRTFPLSEAVMRLPRRVPALRDMLPWIRAKSRIHDAWAARSLGDANVVVAWSGAARKVILEAKRRGALTIVERGSSHIAHQDRVLREEAARYGQAGGVDEADIREELIEYALADYIMVPSKFARRTFLAQGFEPERVLQVPYGADLSVFSPGAKQDGVFRVVFVGAVALQKGVPYILEAFKRLQLPNAELILAGNVWPEMAPILKQYEGLYRAPGSLSRSEVAALLKQASVFVFPSNQEGLALALREALASGVPIIATPDSGAEDVFEDGQEGFLVAPRDVDAISTRIEQLYRDPALRDEMARRAVARARAWSWEDYGDAVVRAYQQVFEARFGQVA